MTYSSSPTLVGNQGLRKTRFKQFFVSIFGTVVEYYDYALYGFTAATIAHHFFPSQDTTTALLKTYSIFAAGSVAKPIGALIFGYLGDIYGRKASLRLTMLGIVIPTIVIGLLPSYHEWGSLSPLLLLTCRLMQGMFVSGESDGVRLFVYESFLKNSPTLANCVVGLACYTGIFFASHATTLASEASLLAPEVWRLPFLLGGLLGIIVFLFRQFIHESVAYEEARKEHTIIPQFELKQYIKPLIATILLCGAVGGSYHIFFVFTSTFVSKILNLTSLSEAHRLTTTCLGGYMGGLVIAALLSDYWSPVKVMITGLIVTITALLILMIEINLDTINPYSWYTIAFSLSFIHAPGFTLILPQFQTLHRYRCLSFGHAIGSMLFSGTAPFYATWLWQYTQSQIAPFINLVVLQALIIIALIIFHFCGSLHKDQKTIVN